MHSDTARTVILIIIAVVFLLIAVANIFIPHKMAEPIGYKLDNNDAKNEYRAIYIGLWIAHSLLFFIASYKNDTPLIGDLGALLLLGQPFGRIISILMDGLPGKQMWSFFFIELIGGLAVLIVRPS